MLFKLWTVRLPGIMPEAPNSNTSLVGKFWSQKENTWKYTIAKMHTVAAGNLPSNLYHPACWHSQAKIVNIAMLTCWKLKWSQGKGKAKISPNPNLEFLERGIYSMFSRFIRCCFHFCWPFFGFLMPTDTGLFDLKCQWMMCVTKRKVLKRLGVVQWGRERYDNV